jgi:hypothetical protein
MAFGAILEGPDPSHLKPLVEEAMPMLIQLMKDESVAVKDTAAWTIGRVCELVHRCCVFALVKHPSIVEMIFNYNMSLSNKSIVHIILLIFKPFTKTFCIFFIIAILTTHIVVPNSRSARQPATLPTYSLFSKPSFRA